MLIHQWLRLLRGRFIDPTNYTVANRTLATTTFRATISTRAPTLSRFCTTRRQSGRLKRLPSTDYRMLKALPRTNHPAGSSRISEQSNDSVIRLNRFVDKLLPCSVMNLIGSPHRRRDARWRDWIMMNEYPVSVLMWHEHLGWENNSSSLKAWIVTCSYTGFNLWKVPF